MSLVTTIVRQWISETLSADAVIASYVAGRIFAGQADENTPFPLIIVAEMSGTDITPPGLLRYGTTLVYGVKAIDMTRSIADLDLLASRIDALLHGQSGITIGNGYVFSSYRTNLLELYGTDRGKSYRQVIQTYKILARES